MNVNNDQIMSLRAKTGAGILECKNALSQSNGNEEAAILILRKLNSNYSEKNLADKSCFHVIDSYVHTNHSVGVLIDVSCQTDFVGNNPDFLKMVHEIAIHIAATNPICIENSLPLDILEREKEIILSQIPANKPEQIKQKILLGKMHNIYSQYCLLEQPFVKDPKKKIKDIIADNKIKFKEEIRINKFIIYK